MLIYILVSPNLRIVIISLASAAFISEFQAIYIVNMALKSLIPGSERCGTRRASSGFMI
jgi:hypothetical protein